MQNLMIFFLLLIQCEAWADNSYWQCSAHDKEEKQWVVKSIYERTATNKAYEACKKQSTAPTTCKIAHEYCEYFTDGFSTRPMWQCTALDQLAKPWVSNTYPNRDDAAIAANDYCKQKSAMPDTCYINLLTCKNLNEKG